MARLGFIARTFVTLNRVFGAVAVLAGILLLLNTLVRLIRTQASLHSVALVAALGLTCLLTGIVYLRAPLNRNHMEH